MGIYMKPIEFDDFGAMNSISALNEFECDFSEQSIIGMIDKVIENEKMTIIDGYVGSTFETIKEYFEEKAEIMCIKDYFFDSATIARLAEPYLPMDKDNDPYLMFGYMCDLTYDKFIDYERLKNDIAERLNANKKVILVGAGSYNDALAFITPFF